MWDNLSSADPRLCRGSADDYASARPKSDGVFNYETTITLFILRADGNDKIFYNTTEVNVCLATAASKIGICQTVSQYV